nr:MAG TPA: hypothetical protein [Crassvirales sp.]
MKSRSVDLSGESSVVKLVLTPMGVLYNPLPSNSGIQIRIVTLRGTKACEGVMSKFSYTKPHGYGLDTHMAGTSIYYPILF